ncbi:B12-binding domain-containing radical SAM protein [Verrucomicrobiota bacterium]
MPDLLIIAGDTAQDFLGQDLREKMRLAVDGVPASLAFLREYFGSGKDARAAVDAASTNEPPFVSLNGPYLRQYLEDQGFTIGLVPLFTPGKDKLLDLLKSGPSAVVISTTFLPIAAQIDAIAGFVKKHAPDVPVIAGGIQVWKSYQHKLLLDRGAITEDIRGPVCEHNYLMDPARPSPLDVLVVSDSGEHTLARLLERIRDGAPYDDLENIAFVVDGKWRTNPIVPEPCAEFGIDWGRHFDGPTAAYVPVQAGLGCGFRCTFCDFCGLRPVKARSAESIVEEVSTIPPLDGVRRVYFTDDNLFPTKERVKEVCRALIESNLNVKWRGLVRISIVDDEVADLMAESGALEIFLGIESGDPEQLARMRKRTTPGEIISGVGHLAKRGISTKSSFIVGFPGETEKSLQNTVHLLNNYPTDGPAVHRYMFFLFGILPLSEVAAPESRALYDLSGYGWEWSHSTMNARTAGELMATLHDRLKLELSPSYVLESPELPGLDIEDIKRIYVLRNRLVQAERSELPTAHLWSKLEGVFAQAGTSGTK